ncbi:ATPase [Moorena producens PAL-8-15-08-1]|uniref:ATPase n=1 Tax=Moorena producens PAL-8-15-08-1 TaxID=1458985 RepID=A0A1D8TU32_9CYAN|nr:MoxR family ATPase [Moorena producens]AOX01152.1 ATPase [Moorena producens PAL-8-15-08-1]
METLNNPKPEYTGNPALQPQPGERDSKGQLLYPYLPSPELIEAVNLAIYLERPLLLKGEPGCGKTRLAHAVAYELNLPLRVWGVKSTTRAKDGLYIYDTVARLRDAQLAATGMIKPEDIPRISNPETYVRWGPLGNAFRSETLTMVLIDEIDKADIDFPNDLLMELDQRQFTVDETGEEVIANQAPIVFITSNDEKDLPDAFLRRCLFHYVEFPYHQLSDILNAHFPKSPEMLVKKAVSRFQELRQQMEKHKGNTGKKVSTSELIDWFKVLRRHPTDEILAQLDGKLPYPGVLLKSVNDHMRYLNPKRL